jgi:hypothetical protein
MREVRVHLHYAGIALHERSRVSIHVAESQPARSFAAKDESALETLEQRFREICGPIRRAVVDDEDVGFGRRLADSAQ